jgi:hypothetical protein
MAASSIKSPVLLFADPNVTPQSATKTPADYYNELFRRDETPVATQPDVIEKTTEAAPVKGVASKA